MFDNPDRLPFSDEHWFTTEMGTYYFFQTKIPGNSYRESLLLYIRLYPFSFLSYCW